MVPRARTIRCAPRQPDDISGSRQSRALAELRSAGQPGRLSPRGLWWVLPTVLGSILWQKTAIQQKSFLSGRVAHFTESVIREMTRQAMLHGAVNLSQGFPDFPAPAEIKRAAQEAIAADVNQYAITWGAKNLRNAIARQMQLWQGIAVDPEREITVCCGSTETMISTLLAVCNAGDEVVIFEPFYENYGPDAILSGAKPRFVKLRPPDTPDGEWTFDERELRAAFHSHTKAIIVNTPEQSHRQGVYPKRTRTDPRSVRGIQRSGHHG